MHTPEWYEKRDIDEFLKTVSCYVLTPTTGGYGKSGTADRIGCCKGNFFAIEVKREGKEPTAIQWKRIHEVEAAGGKAFWGTAAKVIPEIETWLKTI